MRGRLVALGLSGLLASSLASCSSEPLADGGGGFGGETISGLVAGASGRGIVGASVRLRASNSLEEKALREAATDSAGLFRLELPAGTAFRLEVAGWEGTDTVRALVDLDRGQSPGRILAEAQPPRQVRLRDPSGKPVSAVLQAYGLGRAIATDDSGRAVLTGWPSADLWVRATLANGDVYDLFVPASGGDLEVGAGWLLDDFEGGESRTRLGSLVGGGWWYVASQGADSQTVRDIALMKDTLDAHGGRASLHAGFSFPPPASNSYGLVGFHFGPTQADEVDLSGLDSLVFWIKGSGSVRVELVADTGGGVTSHALVLSLDSAWTRHTVTASALAPIDAGRSWAVDSKRVRFLQFIVFQTTDFRLDDLRYYGRARP
ncbi:MAG: carboxypeptidase regulatory-like domain-containing protein [Fibrobacteres bacterium]|nr:carboxypeptidase regulatory-like domain-containing protein [Fibrobacterota bacterium]